MGSICSYFRRESTREQVVLHGVNKDRQHQEKLDNEHMQVDQRILREERRAIRIRTLSFYAPDENRRKRAEQAIRRSIRRAKQMEQSIVRNE